MATYGSYGGCSAGFRAVMVVAGPALGCRLATLLVLWWLLGCLYGCRLATWGSYAGCWAAFKAVIVVVGPSVGS